MFLGEIQAGARLLVDGGVHPGDLVQPPERARPHPQRHAQQPHQPHTHR